MNEFFQMLEDPHARHAMLVHAPIVLCTLGVLPVMALAVTRFRCRSLKLVCVGIFLIASGTAGLAAAAGEEAEEGVEHRGIRLSAEADAALERHEELGEGGWMWPLIPAGLLVLTLLPAREPLNEGEKPKRTVQIVGGSAALAASIGVGVWVGLTAHEGGKLVYQYGVGVPQQSGLNAGDAAGFVPSQWGEYDDD